MKIAFHWMRRSCTVDAPQVVATGLAAMFPELAGPAAAGSTADVRVLRRQPGFVVTASGEEICGTLADALSAAELAVTRRLLESESDHCHLHAAGAVAPNGEAMLVVGPSGSGKSSLAYAWYRMGIPVFGDDVIALDDRGAVHPFPRPLKVDAARLREGGESPEATLAWDPQAPDVWVDPGARAGWARGGASVCLLAGVRFREGAGTRVEGVSGGERLRMLLDSVHQTGLPRAECVHRLIALAERCSAWRLEFGDAGDAARRLLGLVEPRAD